MADKIQKALAKLSLKERLIVEVLIERLLGGDLIGLNIKQLVGNPGAYRLKKGRIRILFSKHRDEGVIIISVSNRDDQTYRDF
jgi:mRNA-degrading endonuclease RelE of RelBE toxin-antitoxin system